VTAFTFPSAPDWLRDTERHQYGGEPVDFNTARQRAIVDRIGPSVKVFPAPDEAARLRSVKAQVKEQTNFDVRDDIVRGWLHGNT
jgi:hypothetical protein